MKKITWIIAACLVVALLLCLPVLTGCDKAGDETQTLDPSEGLVFTSNGDGTCYVSGIGECTDTDVVIPTTSPDGDRVTGIGQQALTSKNITSITIPDSVISIGDRAFQWCTSLTSLDIPSSVTSIGRWTVLYCSALENIHVAEDNPVYHSESNCLIETQSKTLLVGCSNSVIPSDGSVTNIANCAFSRCNMTEIVFPACVINMDGVPILECSMLESIIVSEENPIYHSEGNCLIETQSKTLLAGCMNSVIPTDGSVTSIGPAAFRGCTGLTSITIPDSVTRIESLAFCDCAALECFTIPEGVTSVDKHTFQYCKKLVRNNLPDGLMSIGESAFYGCESLENITLPDDLTSIEEKAFHGCESLENINLPNGLTSIGERAFLGCDSLVNITFPNGLTSIGERAFACCESLANITISKELSSIGKEAFDMCESLSSVTFHGNRSAWKAFLKKTGLVIPDTCTVIYDDYAYDESNKDTILPQEPETQYSTDENTAENSVP